MIVLIKKNFKNNIQSITPLKWGRNKNNCKTTVSNCGFKETSFKTAVSNCGSKRNCKTIVCNCGFKEISVSFKTTVTNGGFLHLKSMWMLTWIKKTTLANIFKWILFLSFFFTNILFWS